MRPAAECFRIGEVVVYVNNDYRILVTVFPDGSFLDAIPHSTPSYKLTARELGYPDDLEGCWEMCRDHELGHSFLAARVGLPWSPTLYAVAHGETFERAAQEEAAVLAFQRLLTARR